MSERIDVPGKDEHPVFQRDPEADLDEKQKLLERRGSRRFHYRLGHFRRVGWVRDVSLIELVGWKTAAQGRVLDLTKSRLREQTAITRPQKRSSDPPVEPRNVDIYLF